MKKAIQQPLVLFNPKLVQQSGSVVFQEGCLSFPSYYADVKRAALITVEGITLTGKPVTIKTDGTLAVCIQHEIDHLNGKLFIDHLSPAKASQLKAKIKKYGYPDMSSFPLKNHSQMHNIIFLGTTSTASYCLKEISRHPNINVKVVIGQNSTDTWQKSKNISGSQSCRHTATPLSYTRELKRSSFFICNLSV